MDPSACSMCGRWIRRCKCTASDGVTQHAKSDDAFAVLPHDVVLLLWTRCSLSALGRLACTSKQVRQSLYKREVWEALRRTWAGSMPIDEPPPGMSMRLAVRAAVEMERRWRTPGSWVQSALPLQRCRAIDKVGEILGADLLPDGKIVLSGIKPATLQVWSVGHSSSHLLTNCLRGRTCVTVSLTQRLSLGSRDPANGSADRA